MSDWKESANERRNFRQSKEQPEVVGRHPKRKTKNICKKLKGPHNFVQHTKSEFTFAGGNKWVWIVLKCTACGKQSYKDFK